MRRRAARLGRVWAAAALALLLAVAARADDAPAPESSPPPGPPAAEAPPATPAETSPPAAAHPAEAKPPETQPPAEPQPAEAQPTEAAAANQIGRSIFVVNDVDGKSGEAAPRRIAVDDDIVFDEDITTGAEAKTVLEFRDGSTFEMGPDAVARIDAFVFNPEESTSQKSVQVSRGVFRYVGGYLASNQDTKIATPSGSLGIRGSVAAGIVDPDVPDFLYVGDGAATFTNQAGSAELQPGNAIAVPSPSTPPMAPAAMPPAVAAQALQVIERRLPPRQALQNRPPTDEAWLRRAGAANLVPSSVQQQHAAAMARGRPLPTVARRSSLAGELGLLVEANRVNLFAGRQTVRTAPQAAFVARAARENPNAAATLRRFTGDARALHVASMNAGTALVLRGVGRAAPSAETLRRVTAASVRANPGAAALINRHAGEALQHREKPGAGRPGERERTNAHSLPERREREAVKPAVRSAKPPQQARKPTPREPAKKQPARKKNEKKEEPPR